MKYYKLFLIAAVATIIVLFFCTRVTAQTVPFREAPEAPIRQMIVQYAASYGVNGTLALAIATCESQLKPLARNTNSTAKGIYQFLDGTWKRYSDMKWGETRDVLSPKDNIELGMWVLATRGTSDWESSRTCWG